MTDPFKDLVQRWRDDAEVLRRHGRGDQADRLERRADEVERALRDRRYQELTVAEVAEIGGYSESRLRTLLSEGKIENVGEPGAPRIRRADVPRKPGGGAPREDGNVSVAERALRREAET